MGITVASTLLLGVFQFMSRTITFRRTVYERGKKAHREVALYQLMDHDLTAIPRGEMKFSAQRDRFSRRTIGSEQMHGKVLDTRVQYVIRAGEDGEHLIRRWRWADVQSEYQNEDILLESDQIRLEYRHPNGEWRIRPGNERPRAVRIDWSQGRVVIPLVAPERRI